MTVITNQRNMRYHDCLDQKYCIKETAAWTVMKYVFLLHYYFGEPLTVPLLSQ